MTTLQTLLAVLAGMLAVVVPVLTVIRPRLNAWLTQRRRRRIGLIHLLEGKPETLDERGVVDPGYPPIMVTLSTLAEQLTRNGGSSLADAIHRIEDTVQQNRRGIEDQIQQLVRQVVEARQVAGHAAVVTARAEEAHHRDHGQLVALLGEMRDRIWERFAEQDVRFDEQRIRELTYVAMLHELGIDLELPDPTPDPDTTVDDG